MQTKGGFVLIGMYIPRVIMFSFPSESQHVAITTGVVGVDWKHRFKGRSVFMVTHLEYVKDS